MALTLEEKLENLRKETAKNLELSENRLRIEHELEEIFPDFNVGYLNHNLYGSIGHISFKVNWYHYSTETKRDLTYSDVIKIAEMFPPIPMTKVRDSCLSFRPTAFVDTIPEEKKEEWDEEMQVVPFTLTLSCFQHQSMKFKWFSMRGNSIISVSCEMRMDTDIANLYMLMKTSAHKGKREKEMVLTINRNKVYTIFSEDETPLAELQSPIKWAVGDESTPNDHTLFWVPYTYENKATIADLLRPVMSC